MTVGRTDPAALAYRGVRAVVLGGSGFIGSWTARALEACGAHVTIVVRNAGGAPAPRGGGQGTLGVVLADLEAVGAPDQVLDATRPSIVFNLAGYGVDRSERDSERMSVLNARMVERLCHRLAAQPDRMWKGLRLVHVGSALEYGRLEGPLRESMPVEPTTEYGRTKLQGTRAVAACCAATELRGVTARLFTVYGPGEHSDRLLPALMRTARTGLPLALTAGRQHRNFTYVEDVAEGLLRLGMSSASPGTVVNLASGLVTSVREFAETAAAVLRIDPRLLDFGVLPERDDEMWHGEVDVSRLRALTAWTPPTGIADGIRRTWQVSGGG